MIDSVLVSVIMPSYNQGLFITDALESVCNQTYQNWECIIIDDGSTDNTSAIVDPFLKKDIRIKYTKIPNGGVSRARNTAINMAAGEYILPLDADDRISENYLEECVKEFFNHPSTKIVYGRAEFFGEQTGEWPLHEFDYKRMLTRNMVYCSAMMRKTDCKLIGGYDESMLFGLEDWDFWIRFLTYDSIVTRKNNIVFYYRIKQHSRNTDLYKNEFHRQQTYEYLYQKHYDKMNPVIGSPIQLYIEKEELEKHTWNLEQLLNQANRKKSILGRILSKIKKL